MTAFRLQIPTAHLQYFCTTLSNFRNDSMDCSKQMTTYPTLPTHLGTLVAQYVGLVTLSQCTVLFAFVEKCCSLMSSMLTHDNILVTSFSSAMAAMSLVITRY